MLLPSRPFLISPYLWPYSMGGYHWLGGRIDSIETKYSHHIKWYNKVEFRDSNFSYQNKTTLDCSYWIQEYKNFDQIPLETLFQILKLRGWRSFAWAKFLEFNLYIRRISRLSDMWIDFDDSVPEHASKNFHRRGHNMARCRVWMFIFIDNNYGF